MADAVAAVNIKVTDLEPFKRFIALVAKANAHFYALSVDEVKALPGGACAGIAALQGALRELGIDSARPEETPDDPAAT